MSINVEFGSDSDKRKDRVDNIRRKWQKAKINKQKLQERLNHIGKNSKIHDMRMKTALKASKTYRDIIRNAAKNATTVEESAKALGHDLRNVQRYAEMWMSRDEATALYQLEIAKEAVRTLEKNSFNLDLGAILKAGLGGAGLGAAAKRIANMFFGSKGGVGKKALEDAIKGVAMETTNQFVDGVTNTYNKWSRVRRLKLLFDTVEKEKAKVRSEVIKLFKQKIKQQEAKQEKQKAEREKLQNKKIDTKCAIMDFSKKIGTLEALADKEINPQNWNGSTYIGKKFGTFNGVEKNNGFTDCGQPQNFVQTNCGNDNGGCGGFSMNCDSDGNCTQNFSCSDAPSWMGSDSGGLSDSMGGSGNDGGGKDGCSIM